MPGQTSQERNYFLACYAVSLTQGDTILGGSIRSRTLKHYLEDAKVLFQSRRISTRSLDDTDYIDIIFSTLKKYEAIPNRRNMISDGMMVWLLSLAKKSDRERHFCNR